MKQNNGGQRPILACFGSHIGQNRVLLVCFSRNQTVSSILAPVSVGIGPNRSQSAGFVPNRAELKKRVNQRIGHRTPRRGESGAGAVALKLHPCFLTDLLEFAEKVPTFVCRKLFQSVCFFNKDESYNLVLLFPT